MFMIVVERCLWLFWKLVGFVHFYHNCCKSGLGLIISLLSLWKWVGFGHFTAIAVEVGGFGHFTAIAVEVGWAWSF